MPHSKPRANALGNKYLTRILRARRPRKANGECVMLARTSSYIRIIIVLLENGGVYVYSCEFGGF